MKLFILKRRQFVPSPLREVFAFFSKPENLAVLTPKNLGFDILTPSPVSMKEGTVIDYTIKIAGFPVRWTTLITSYEPPYRFVDLQLKGPYSYWHHTHTFTETNEGTFIDDEVRYGLPFGVFGLLAHALFVKRQLNAIFAQRGNVIKTIFPDQMSSGFQRKNVLTKPEVIA
jgi:ligand-binding SRPBCC domain-containing protein